MHRYVAPPAELFAHNRARFIEQMQPDSVALFFSNDLITTNGDGHYRFTQNTQLYYLTGIDQEKCVLALAPGHPDPDLREVLFLQPTNAQIQLWEGWKYSPQEATAASGIENVRALDTFEVHLRGLLARFGQVYLDFNEHQRNSSLNVGESYRLAQRLQSDWPAHRILRAYPLLLRQRMHKHPHELAQLREAIRITAVAFEAVLTFVKPGVTEYEIEALILHEFLRQRASGAAYESIIASGPNACVLHYILNSQVCQDGHVLLMDFGAKYAHYNADLTRCIPVNGRFSARQRAVYDAVHRVQQAAIGRLVPGTSFREYDQAAREHMQEELLGLGLISQDDIRNAPKGRPAHRKYFPHGLSHHLGLETHDIGSFDIDIQPGMVFTVEPGIYIPEEGIGIRLENNVLVTANGPDDLMAGVPLAADDIEARMNA